MWSGAVGAVAARVVAAVPADTPTAAAAVVADTVSGPGSSVWLYLLGGGSAVAILKMIVDAVRSFFTGKWAQDERRDASLIAQRDKAWEERDEERAARERAERNVQAVIDYAGQLRYLCRIHGVPPEEIPAYPELERNPNGRSPGGLP